MTEPKVLKTKVVKMPLYELNGEPRATLGDGKNWVSMKYRDVPRASGSAT